MVDGEQKARVVGQVVMRPLASVRRNAWNPNKMDPQTYASTKHGFITDGWLASQALLIWGTDDKGVEQNVIIDGEHRHTIGLELGMLEGPMVFLDGLTEAQAKALTIKMNQKRGEFDQVELARLVQSIQFDLNVEDIALDLGFATEDAMRMLSLNVEELAGAVANPPAETPLESSGPPQGGDTPQPPPNKAIRLVQIVFNEAQHEEFRAAATKLGERYGLKTVTDVVLEAVKREVAHE